MHEKSVDKIRGKIKGCLKRCEVVDNWPQYESFTEHVDSISDEVLKSKSQWISRIEVYSIFYDLVYEFIVGATDPEAKYTGQLIELTDEDILDKLVDSLCAFYVSIPRKYSVYLPLPKISKNVQGLIPLTDRVELEFIENMDDLPGGYHRSLLQFSNKFEINRAYLKISLKGFCNSSLENKIVKQALSNFKIIIQQGLHRGLFEIIEGRQQASLGFIGSMTHHQVPKSKIVSIDQTDEIQRIISTELSIEMSKFLDSIDFNWSNKKVNTAYDAGNIDMPIKGYLRLPSLLIESNEPESARVKSAIEWCFDSKVNENETLSFLQICIGLESLLGDDDSNGGLTETLADRCAYLISNNIKERSTIKKQFKDLYKVRSKLVHGVKTTLEHDQKWYKKWGGSILEVAIIKEIKHLEL